jgi:hypothetical protein
MNGGAAPPPDLSYDLNAGMAGENIRQIITTRAFSVLIESEL